MFLRGTAIVARVESEVPLKHTKGFFHGSRRLKGFSRRLFEADTRQYSSHC